MAELPGFSLWIVRGSWNRNAATQHNVDVDGRVHEAPVCRPSRTMAMGRLMYHIISGLGS